MNFSTDPWYYLDPFNIVSAVENNDAFISSLYVTVKAVGYIGCVISLLLAFGQFALSDSAHEAGEAKKKIMKTLAVAFFLSVLAWVLGLVLGILVLI